VRQFISFAMVAVLLSGCAGQSEKPLRYSGFLSTKYYDRLTKVETPSGQILFRYLDPDFIPSNYHQVIVDPVGAYPEPKKNKHMSMDMLQILKSRFTNFLENGFSKVLPLTDTPGVGVLRIQIAITGVDVSSKGLEPYEYLPFALIAAGANTAAGGSFFSLGANFIAPLDIGGGLQAQVEIETANQEAALATYGSIALNAFNEVESALTNETLLLEREGFLGDAVENNKGALETVRVQYDVGQVDFLSVLQLQARTLNSQISLIRIKNARLAQRVDLHLALGGSFSE